MNCSVRVKTSNLVLFTLLIFSNRQFSAFFTEDLVNNTAEKYERRPSLDQVAVDPLLTMVGIEREAKCVSPLYRMAYLGQGVLEVFDDLFGHNKHPLYDRGDYEPEDLVLVRELAKLMRKLKAGSDSVQKFALTSNHFFVRTHRQIVLPKEFKYLKENTERVGPETRGMIIYDQFWPFYNQNHNDENCVPVKDLPLFYKEIVEH